MPSEDEAKPTIPSTPTKKKSSSKEPITPNKSPRKKLAADDLQSMKREAINAVFDFAVKGDTLALIAERSGLSETQVRDLSRTGRAGNTRAKCMALLDSGTLEIRWAN